MIVMVMILKRMMMIMLVTTVMMTMIVMMAMVMIMILTYRLHPCGDFLDDPGPPLQDHQRYMHDHVFVCHDHVKISWKISSMVHVMILFNCAMLKVLIFNIINVMGAMISFFAGNDHVQLRDSA